jgi:hypothetical protein
MQENINFWFGLFAAVCFCWAALWGIAKSTYETVYGWGFKSHLALAVSFVVSAFIAYHAVHFLKFFFAASLRSIGIGIATYYL